MAAKHSEESVLGGRSFSSDIKVRREAPYVLRWFTRATRFEFRFRRQVGAKMTAEPMEWLGL